MFETITTEEVLTLIPQDPDHIGYVSKNDNVYVYCPFCSTSAKKKSAALSRTKNVFHCFHCDTGTSAQEYFNKMFPEKEFPIVKPILRTKEKVAEPIKEQSPVFLNQVYSALLSLLKLSERHSQDLLKRGLLPEEIKDIGFATIDRSIDTFEICDKIKKMLNVTSLKGVPGFYLYKKSWNFPCPQSAILVPYRNSDGYIIRLQERKDDGTYGEKGKYTYFTSAARNCGLSATSRADWAVDRVWSVKHQKFEPLVGKTITLTEGGMKGQIIHAISGEPVISIAGVTQRSALRPELPILKSLGVECVALKFDMDYIDNEKVSNAMMSVTTLLQREGFEVTRPLWDKEMKGYDDFLSKKYRQ